MKTRLEVSNLVYHTRNIQCRSRTIIPSIHEKQKDEKHSKDIYIPYFLSLSLYTLVLILENNTVNKPVK